LGNVSHQVKEPFPELVHGEHFVGRVAVEEEGLAKQGEIPVGEEED
jgi:hypothetical protein